MTTPKLFVALDIETTGLDVEEDVILEIAWQIVDESFAPETEARSYLVEQRDWTQFSHQLNENPVVKKMHHESGLLGDLLGLQGTPMWKIAEQLKGDIRDARSAFTFTLSPEVHLLGMSVEFDREFLQADEEFADIFDKKGTWFHHRLLNLSSVKLLLDVAEVAWPDAAASNDNPHRALTDVEQVVRQAQAFKNVLAPLVPNRGESPFNMSFTDDEEFE